MKIKLITVMFLCMCLSLFLGCGSIKYNNTNNHSDIITKVYSVQEIEDFKEQSRMSTISFSDFKKRFDVECVRKTSQGYYAILHKEDGNKVFFFFNNDLSDILDILDIKHFTLKEKFENILINQTTRNEILAIDPNTIFLPVSSVRMTAHIVSDGMFIITYDTYVIEGEFSNDPKVVEINFVSDEEFLQGTTDVIYLTPFILPIDKTGDGSAS